MAYENLGDFGGYVHQPREYHKTGLITDFNLVLKLYNMHIKGIPLENSLVQRSMNVLEQEIKSGNIAPLSGLGFAILSEDMLNVARWDNEYPIVLKNQIYEKSNDKFNPVDIRKVGPFCVWELGIVNYERNEWIKYLQSQRVEEDKSIYLNSFYEGSSEINKDILSRSIFDFEISTKLRNGLLQCGIKTVDEALNALRKKQFRHVKNVGNATENELENLLKSLKILN